MTKLALADMAARVGAPMHTQRILRAVPDPDPEPEVLPPASTVRPDTFDDIIGQEEAKLQILAVLTAAERRNLPAYPHILLDGPSGVGKTTFAKAIANRRGTRCHITAPNALRTPWDAACLMAEVQRGDVVFIDEIHGLSKRTMEALYPVLEGDPMPVSSGSGRNRKVSTMKVPPFTMIGGTTSTGGLTEPFRNRFAVDVTLRRYTDDEISRILRRAAEAQGILITADGADKLALLARGTARVAVNELLVKAEAVAVSMADPEAETTPIDADVVANTMTAYGIDELGLKPKERAMLRALCIDMAGGPIGIKKLAAASGLDTRTADEVEEWMTRCRLMWYDGSGRKATVLAYKHLSDTDPDGRQYKPPAWIVAWSRQVGATDERWLAGFSA